VRERLVSRRTSVINSDSSVPVGARGISFAKGPASLREQMPEILENADEKLTARTRRLWESLLAFHFGEPSLLHCAAFGASRLDDQELPSTNCAA
jgi:hypothetical protein